MAAAHEEVRESHRERVDRLLAGMDQRVATLEDEVASLHRVLDARTAQSEEIMLLRRVVSGGKA